MSFKSSFQPVAATLPTNLIFEPCGQSTLPAEITIPGAAAADSNELLAEPTDDTFAVNTSTASAATSITSAAEHVPTPYTPEITQLCARVASKVAKMPIDRVPDVCVPTFPQFGEALSRDSHCCKSNDFDFTRAQGFAILQQNLAYAASAAYLHANNQIVVHPWASEVLSAFEDDWTLKMLMVHEMTHAAQAQKYPHLFEKINEAREQMITNMDAPINSLKSIWRMRQANTQLAKSTNSILILLEGHATWVQRTAGEQAFARSQGLLARVGNKYWDLFNPVDGLFHSRNSYSLGLPLVYAVKKLQTELESAPFRDFSGNLVELRPNLRGDGLMDILFTHPEMVNELLPNQHSWRAASRERVNIDFLRQLIIRLPGHPPV